MGIEAAQRWRQWHGTRRVRASGRYAVAACACLHGVRTRMVGDGKASMTLDVYADLFDEDLDTVAANLDAAIESAAARLRHPPVS